LVTLVLNRLWLNRRDTGEAISGPSGRDRSTSYTMAGEVRTYASGRQRAVATAGVQGQVQRTFVNLDRATVELLRSWLGLGVQLRDHRGGKWEGVFFDVSVSEYMHPGMYSATVALNTTTGDG
jgi:hypothetical protein